MPQNGIRGRLDAAWNTPPTDRPTRIATYIGHQSLLIFLTLSPLPQYSTPEVEEQERVDPHLHAGRFFTLLYFIFLGACHNLPIYLHRSTLHRAFMWPCFKRSRTIF